NWKGIGKFYLKQKIFKVYIKKRTKQEKIIFCIVREVPMKQARFLFLIKSVLVSLKIKKSYFLVEVKYD
ncbi:hypothetical protein, partial [uncultured Megasphaera sp.]|uniref:hypothetical protein n=1 Tax=uncultured Megasphaera sp. TaxID=165188 RepID=UPI0025989461